MGGKKEVVDKNCSLVVGQWKKGSDIVGRRSVEKMASENESAGQR